ncbi:hypothetical protein BGZ47_005666 [Haplosporangium gracile]|nr:hypothetical protein BGZ47_005666 [Haplosporangium gracile]
MLHPTKATIGSVLSLTLTLTLLSPYHTAHAQYTSINTASGAAYVRHQNQFYVAGGGLIREVKPQSGFNTQPESTVGDGQFAVLDLSVPWAGSTAAWKKLAPGPKVMDFPFAMNANGSKMIAFRAGVNANESFASIYDVASNTWKPSSIIVPKWDQDGIEAVLDPRTDRVYMAGGFEGDNKLDQMYVYYWDSDKLMKSPMVARGESQILYYKAVWWSKENSILYFGGYAQTTAGTFVRADVNVYNPDAGSWTALQTTGTKPGERSDMCMAVSDDGTRLVIFGGRYFTWSSQSIMSEMYVLDLTTMVWTRGQDYATPRIYTTCTIVDDTFLSWGGTDTFSTVNAPIIIYDIKRNKYLSQFKGPDPDKDFDPLVPPKPSSSGSGSRGNSNSGGEGKEMTFEERRNLILGCVFGGAALFWFTVCCCVCRVRRNRAYRVQEVLDAAERKITEENERAVKRQTVVPVPTAATRASTATAAAGGAKVNATATVNGQRPSQHLSSPPESNPTHSYNPPDLNPTPSCRPQAKSTHHSLNSKDKDRATDNHTPCYHSNTNTKLARSVPHRYTQCSISKNIIGSQNPPPPSQTNLAAHLKSFLQISPTTV